MVIPSINKMFFSLAGNNNMYFSQALIHYVKADHSSASITFKGV